MFRLALILAVTGCASRAVPPRSTTSSPPPAAPRDPSATGVWNDLFVPRAALGERTLEMLAIAPASPWGPVTVGWGDVSQPYVVRSEMLGPYGVTIDGAPMKLDKIPAHILRVTLTFGREQPDGPFAAGTNLEILPIEANAMLEDASMRWKAFLAAQQKAIDAALVDADHQSGGRPLGPETTQTDDAYVPTWLPRTQQLRVTYARTLYRSSELTERIDGEGGCAKYENRGNLPGFPDDRVLVACPAPPPPQIRRHQRTYSVVFALVLTYAADGHLVSAEPFAPHPVPAKGPF